LLMLERTHAHPLTHTPLAFGRCSSTIQYTRCSTHTGTRKQACVDDDRGPKQACVHDDRGPVFRPFPLLLMLFRTCRQSLTPSLSPSPPPPFSPVPCDLSPVTCPLSSLPSPSPLSFPAPIPPSFLAPYTPLLHLSLPCPTSTSFTTLPLPHTV